MENVKLIECPRDAWQGLADFIPTEFKANYLKELVLAGFKHIDAVSFVSPKHVKQMADSEEVMARLNDSLPAEIERPEIIGIVVNEKGLERALKTPGVTTIGYPYSISAYFRRANANMSRDESRKLVETLERLKDIRVRTVSLADTAGTASAESITEVFRRASNYVAGMEIGVHLHSTPMGAADKILAAYNAGCRRFDSALTGLGGCPFAGDELVGNIATEDVLAALSLAGYTQEQTGLHLEKVVKLTNEVRATYAHAP